MSDSKSAARHPEGYGSVVASGIGGMVGGGTVAVLGPSIPITKGGSAARLRPGRRGGSANGVVLRWAVRDTPQRARPPLKLPARPYALVSKTYPSRGGTVTVVNRAFGTGLFSGGIIVVLWLSYIAMLAP